MHKTELSLAACLVLGCAARPPAGDAGDSETSGQTETQTQAETETETGGDEGPFWVYSSDLHPRALVATNDGVIVGGAYLSQSPMSELALREADVVALDGTGSLLWSATWLSEDLPASVAALARDADGIWVGFEGEECGDWCFQSTVSRLDHDGVEQWRLDAPLDGSLQTVYAIDGEVIVATVDWSPMRSHLYRLDADGVEQWRWDTNPNDMAPPHVYDVELVFDSLWAVGTRTGEMILEVPWVGRFDPDTGAYFGPVFAGLDATDTLADEIELLGDGVVVTTATKLAALEIDGVRSWQVSIPAGRCPIVHHNDQLMIGCETELQLRDVQSTLITKWQDLEVTTEHWHWQDVALGERAYAGIGSASWWVEEPGKVYGIALE